MESVELLLTDEFAKFSTEIQKIHEVKSAITKDFKAMYAKYQQDCAQLDGKAKEAQNEWEQWKNGLMEAKKNKEHK